MPKQTAKERQAKRRAKVRENSELYQSYLQKDKERKKKRRDEAKQSMTPSELEEYRMKEKMRVKQYRAKKAAEDCQPSTSTPYRSTQARGKAIK